MGQVWIKCLTIVRAADEHGVLKTYYPGDWCQVGGHQARLLVAQRSAEIQNRSARAQVLDLTGCGVSAYGDAPAAARLVSRHYPELSVQIDGTPRLVASYTLILDPRCNPNMPLIPVGFHRLKAGWEMAVPLIPHPTAKWEYLTANDIGTPADRAKTKAVVRDLRCPVYDPRMVFALRCEAAEAVIAQWLEERAEKHADERLAFLRAFYTHKPLMCALPASWYSAR